ncbi:MAG TPA: aspartate kinase [Polyangiaceae bacterium]
MKTTTVEKIGGTSMTRFPEVLENVVLKDPDRVYGRIYVVSAYAGVTDKLLEHKKTRAPGVYVEFANRGRYQQALQELGDQLRRLNQDYVAAGLDLAVADAFISERVAGANEYLRSMARVLASGYLRRESVLAAARELLASLGEMHSAFNAANILQNRGYHSTFVDLSGWDDDRELSLDERIADAFEKVDPQRTITFATGYAKGTEGIMREYNRGYSEVTFSKIAVQVKAHEAIIIKEFHLSSADPGIVGPDRAKPVCNTNFDVADQLADVGMEAIHPKASKPLELNGIPIRVRNAFDPDHDGTLITKDYVCEFSKVEVVTGTKNVSTLEIHDTKMVGEVGFDLRIMEILAHHHVSYISKATNANTIGMIVWDQDVTEALIEDLRAKFEEVTVKPVAIVCAIGSNIAKPGILAVATNSLAQAKINIIGVSQTARQTNMQFVVERAEFVHAQQVLHRDLCE